MAGPAALSATPDSAPDPYALASYSYELPPELIAQAPAEPRDSARLLVLDRASGAIGHRRVSDLPLLLAPGDLVVANRSRVIPARLIGHKPTGGEVEILLLRPEGENTWLALTRGHRLRAGQRIDIAPGFAVELGEALDGGQRLVHLPDDADVRGLLQRHGQVPLPPYIHAYRGDPERYQTVYAEVEGSAAAPTAGLHFTPELIARIQSAGVNWEWITLHIGLDTFKPMMVDDVRDHHIHTEWIDVPEETALAIARGRGRGGRVVAIGTTTVRSLEHASRDGETRAYQGPADLFIMPGYEFRAVDAMLTNFHLPHSSLLLLVSAFAERDRILAAYEEAVHLRYRFFSFGDAMLIL